MNPPVSQCRRALQRQIVPPKDALWITDGLLASAFERYCCVSRTWNRKASNVPGPLESQRRLGRRRMGAASTWHCPPTPPSWAFLVPMDLTQWTWKPPSLASDRKSSRAQQDTAGSADLLSLLPQWLRESESRADDPRIVLPTTALPEPKPPPAVAARAAPGAAVMDDFRWAATHADDADFVFYTNNMCSRLRQRIILGEMRAPELAQLSREVWETLESRLRGSRLGHQLSLSFCRAVLSGLTTSKVFSAALMNASFWNALLMQMAKLPADDRLCNLLVKVMAAIPVAHRSRVSKSVAAVLGCFFSAWARSSAAPEGQQTRRLLDVTFLGELYESQAKLAALPPCLRQARAISAALACATPEETKRLLHAAHRLVLGEAAAATKGRQVLRFSWLYMLARQPHVNEDFLFDAAAALSDPSLDMPPLSAVEVSSLLLTQWDSRGYLQSPEGVYRFYRRHRGKRDEAALASLCLAIFSRGNGETRKGLYRSAWKLLARLRQTDYVARSLAFDACTGKLPVRMLEDLACASNDHRVAIRLRDLWAGAIMTADQPQWYPGVFDKYAEAIVRDPQIPAKEIWRVLDIGKLEGSGAPGRRQRLLRHRGTFGQRRAAVVEKAAQAFMAAPHLSDRAALRHVSRSLAFLRAVRGKVPDFVIRDLYRLVTQDMWEEKPGRTKRLLWFLRVIERRHGLQVAWECRLVLRRWRARLTKIWLSKGGGIQHY